MENKWVYYIFLIFLEIFPQLKLEQNLEYKSYYLQVMKHSTLWKSQWLRNLFYWLWICYWLDEARCALKYRFKDHKNYIKKQELNIIQENNSMKKYSISQYMTYNVKIIISDLKTYL